MNFNHSDFKRVDRQAFYFYLKTTPGLHNWTFPAMWGCTDNDGICRCFLVTKPEEVEFYINVQDCSRLKLTGYKKSVQSKDLERR